MKYEKRLWASRPARHPEGASALFHDHAAISFLGATDGAGAVMQAILAALAASWAGFGYPASHVWNLW